MTNPASPLPPPESPEEELARLRRVAVVDELLHTFAGVLDVRDRGSARVVPNDLADSDVRVITG